MTGWKITIEQRDYANPTILHGRNLTGGVGRITWEGELSDEYFQWFEISFKLRDILELTPSEAEQTVNGHRTVYLPLTQVGNQH